LGHFQGPPCVGVSDGPFRLLPVYGRLARMKGHDLIGTPLGCMVASILVLTKG
jgi:hypothetical protein